MTEGYDDRGAAGARAILPCRHRARPRRIRLAVAGWHPGWPPPPTWGYPPGWEPAPSPPGAAPGG